MAELWGCEERGRQAAREAGSGRCVEGVGISLRAVKLSL